MMWECKGESHRYFERNLEIQEPGSGIYSLSNGILETFQNRGLSKSDFCLRQVSLAWVRGRLREGMRLQRRRTNSQETSGQRRAVAREMGRKDGGQMSSRWKSTRI